MGINYESHFNASVIVRDSQRRQCLQTTTSEVKGEPKLENPSWGTEPTSSARRPNAYNRRGQLASLTLITAGPNRLSADSVESKRFYSMVPQNGHDLGGPSPLTLRPHPAVPAITPLSPYFAFIVTFLTTPSGVVKRRLFASK